jgi:tRNA threonylcarbamoyl adenosine modification protein YeaZ
VLLLALDTATSVVSVAVHDGRHVLAERSESGAKRHAELLAPAVVDVLHAAGASARDLTDIAVGVGPGPFTGLRVGVMTARTLGAALSLRVRGVCTLDVLAAAVAEGGPFVVATDARRREVYWASYADPRTRLDGPRVSRPADIATEQPVVGRGAELYPDAFPCARPPLDPSAAVLATAVVEGKVSTLEAQPLYLRRPDIAEPGERKRVL